MEEFFKKAFSWLKTAPKWVRVVVPFVLAALVAIYMFSSCNVLRSVDVERRQTRSVFDTTTVRVSSYVRTTRTRHTIGASRLDAFRTCSLP